MKLKYFTALVSLLVILAFANATAADLITGQSVSSITATGATINWTSCAAANSQVKYQGPSAAFTSAGTSLSGWVTTGGGVTIDTGTGNPLNSFKVAPGQQAHVDAGVAAGQTIQFDFFFYNATAALADFYFGSNAAGLGYGLRLDGRPATKSGIYNAASFVSTGVGTVIGPIATSVWHTVVIAISSDGTQATWSLDGAQKESFQLTSGIVGPYIGLYGDGGSNGANFDNISVSGSAVSSQTTVDATLVTSHSIALTGLSSGMLYHYQVTSIDSSGNTLTGADATFATAGGTPAIGTNPLDTTACNGNTATLIATASGSPTPTVQWQVSTNGGSTYSNIAGATSTNYSFTALTSQTGYKYKAVFTNATGSVTSTAATLTVNATPVVTTQPISKSAAAGSTASFVVAGSGTPSPTVQWQQSVNAGVTWTNISGATSTTLSLPSTTLSQSGSQYRAILTNSCGSVTSSIVTLTVTSGAAYNISFSTASNRSSGAFLQGATLSGLRYVFTSLASSATTSAISGVSKVCFWLDNTAMTGTATSCAAASPFDYNVSTTPIALVHQTSGQNAAGGTFGITIPATTSTNFLAIIVAENANPTNPAPDVTLTDNLGSTYLVATNQTVGSSFLHRHKVFYLKNIPSGITTLTVASPNQADVLALEYSGVEGTVDGATTASAQSALTAFTSGTLATTANDLLLGVAENTGAATYTAGTGWTSLANVTNSGIANNTFVTLIEQRLNTIAGTYAATGTSSSVQDTKSILVAFKSKIGSQAWDTTAIANGTHTITQQVTPAAGAVENDTATFTISNTAPHSVSMTWVKGTASNPVTYTVIRTTGACPGGPLIGPSVASGLGTPAFTDTTVASGTTYCYAISQRDSVTAIQSPPSNAAPAVIP